MSTPTAPEDAIAAAAAAVPGVAWLSGSLSAYLPGRSVPGVQIDEDAVRVAIVARYGIPLTQITADLDLALAPLTGGRELLVRVEDLVLPGESEPAAEAPRSELASPAASTSPAPAPPAAGPVS